MKKLRLILAYVCVCVFMFGCSEKPSPSEVKKEIPKSEEISYTEIEHPLAGLDREKNFYWGTEIKNAENLKHIFYIRVGENYQWKSFSLEGNKFVESELSWGEKINIDIDGGDILIGLEQDDEEENTYICALKKKKFFLYSISEWSGEIEEILLNEKLQLSENEKVEKMIITPEDKLVFFTIKESKEGRENCATILYDPMVGEIMCEQDYIPPRYLCIGEDNIMYYIDEYENCIFGKEFGSNIPKLAIPFKDIEQLDIYCRLAVKDGRWAVYTPSGIYTGDLDEKGGKKVIDVKDYYKNEQGYYINKFQMVSGEEKEFYVLVVLNDNETTKWIHYY